MAQRHYSISQHQLKMRSSVRIVPLDYRITLVSRRIAWCSFFLTLGLSVFLQDAHADDTAVANLSKRLAPKLAAARYMQQDCSPIVHPGWEEFPTINCRYVVKDKSGRKKATRVIMLNPDADRLATWIVNACRETGTMKLSICTQKLTKRILDQSGGQFPVAGVVYEDILPEDGTFEAYAFRDGVTVGVKGMPHHATGELPETQIDAAVTDPPTWAGKFARLQGTTRGEYLAAGGTKESKGLAWLGVSREDYQATWNTGRSELMSAWLTSTK